MKKIEKVFGFIFSGILITIVFISIFYSLFTLVFRDGHGLASYGNRGEFYMSE